MAYDVRDVTTPGFGMPMGVVDDVAPTDIAKFGGITGSLKSDTPGGGVGTGLNWNIGTGQLALGGLQSIGNLWSAFQAQKLAKDQFNFSKDFANANLANQIKSYNTRLEDKVTARAVQQGEAPGWAQDYVNRNRMSR